MARHKQTFSSREHGRNVFPVRERTSSFSIDRLSTLIDDPFRSLRVCYLKRIICPRLFASFFAVSGVVPKLQRETRRYTRTTREVGFPAEHEMRENLKVPPCFRPNASRRQAHRGSARRLSPPEGGRA